MTTILVTFVVVLLRFQVMCKPSWSSHSAFYASVAIVLLLATNCLFLQALGKAFWAQSVTSFLKVLAASAWAQATLADFVCGAVVLAFWIGNRPGENVIGFPNFAWACCVPFLGNPVAASYLAAAFFQARSVASVLVPHECVSEDVVVGFRTARRGIAAASAVLLALYCSFLVRAVLSEDLLAGYHVLKEAPLVWATFLDNLIGAGCVALIIGYREGTTLQAVVWISALALFGHGVSLLYTLLVCAEAEKADRSLGAVWATTSRSSRQRPAYV